MSYLAVVEVPQWQGSSAAGARRLTAGARSLADLFPVSHRVLPEVDVRSGSGYVTAGVRDLGVLAVNLGAVRAALERVNAPVVVTVGGDCGVEVAPIERALRRHGDRLAVVWFDAHGDLNTPVSSVSGAFHGMVLRTLLGEGPEEMRPTLALTPGQIVLAGVRALDAGERWFIDAHRIRRVGVAELAEPSALIAAVTATGAKAVYVHIDLDVLDPGIFSSVGCPDPEGVSPHRLAEAVSALGECFSIAGLGITEHQPADGDPIRADEAAVLKQLAPTLADIVAGTASEEVRRIERHAIGAWPAPITDSFGGWIVRHTPGMHRLRSGNTALLLAPHSEGLSDLPGVEAFYAERGLAAIVQVSPAARRIRLDEHLAARGYRLDTPVQVLAAPAETIGCGPQFADRWAVQVGPTPPAEWMRAFIELDGHRDSRGIAEQVISKITLPCAYASVTAGGRVAGIGLVVGGDDQWAGFYCMATHPAHRRQGVAAAILRAGARWAVAHDIAGLYLQMAQSNTAARDLYGRAGFAHAYSYHYRVRAAFGSMSTSSAASNA